MQLLVHHRTINEEKVPMFVKKNKHCVARGQFPARSAANRSNAAGHSLKAVAPMSPLTSDVLTHWQFQRPLGQWYRSPTENMRWDGELHGTVPVLLQLCHLIDCP